MNIRISDVDAIMEALDNIEDDAPIILINDDDIPVAVMMSYADYESI